MTEAERAVFDMMVAIILTLPSSDPSHTNRLNVFVDAFTRLQSERGRPVVERTFEGTVRKPRSPTPCDKHDCWCVRPKEPLQCS